MCQVPAACSIWIFPKVLDNFHHIHAQTQDSTAHRPTDPLNISVSMTSFILSCQKVVVNFRQQLFSTRHAICLQLGKHLRLQYVFQLQCGKTTWIKLIKAEQADEGSRHIAPNLKSIQLLKEHRKRKRWTGALRQLSTFVRAVHIFRLQQIRLTKHIHIFANKYYLTMTKTVVASGACPDIQ